VLILTPNLSLNSQNTANFYDLTTDNGTNGYGIDGNITYSDIKAIRLLTADYNTLNTPSVPAEGGFTQYVQYMKISGSPELIDGKTFNVGDIFVPQSTGLTTVSPENWETTGYYVYPFLNTWLPTAAQTPLEISISQLNQSGNTIANNIYIYGYEVYYNQQTDDFTTVENATYMLIGGSAIYLGNMYVSGEVFTATDSSEAIVTGTVVQLYASTSGYAPLIYEILTGINDLTEQQIGLNNQDLVQPQENYILKLRTKIEAINYACKTNNVSMLYCYETIQYLQARISQLLHP